MRTAQIQEARSPRKKGLLTLDKKWTSHSLTLHSCLPWCYLILNMQPIFMRIHPSLPTMHFISSLFLFYTRNVNGGNRISFWPLCKRYGAAAILLVTYGSELYIVPLDLARSFGAICALYSYRVIHHAINNMRARFEFMQETQLTLNKTIWRA